MFSVILSNEKNETLTLDYSLNESVSAKLWFESLKKAATQSQIDSSRFYNFFSGNELPALTARLEFAIKSLGLDFGALDKASDQSLQKSLNLLHQNFAHNHLVAKSIRPENLNLWSEFNEIIHTIESVLVAKKIVTPIPLSRIEFSWSNAFKFAIPEQCFSEFSLLKEFGSLQISYCQVGRHLTELFAANDLELPIEHIQPARFFSANSALWFGPDIPAVYEANYLVEIEKWFKQNEPKFNAAGVHWDRPDKALGLVTVAQLNKKFNSIEEQRQFQREIAHFNTVLKVQIS